MRKEMIERYGDPGSLRTLCTSRRRNNGSSSLLVTYWLTNRSTPFDFRLADRLSPLKQTDTRIAASDLIDLSWKSVTQTVRGPRPGNPAGVLVSLRSVVATQLSVGHLTQTNRRALRLSYYLLPAGVEKLRCEAKNILLRRVLTGQNSTTGVCLTLLKGVR